MAHTKTTPLLELLEQRKSWQGYEELKLGDAPVYRAPEFDAVQLRRIEEAARLHAKANPSDPHAYGRIKLHLVRGIEHSEEITRDAQAILTNRERARDTHATTVG